jgi:acyl-CoA synthetase (AMP-forming)/AMP-acid ligase II
VVKRTYGSTEAPTVTTSQPDDPPERARDTDGRSTGAAHARISDPATGAEQPVGETGELWLRGPELFVGYADPEQTQLVIDRGWFRTGDLATVDADGWLTIVGRIKDIIIRGGENIAAAEVESVLEHHPDVRHAVAVGYPDDRLGERVCVFVVADRPFTLVECREWFERSGVARYKTPEKVIQVDDVPAIGPGKPDRAALRARAAAE